MTLHINSSSLLYVNMSSLTSRHDAAAQRTRVFRLQRRIVCSSPAQCAGSLVELSDRMLSVGLMEFLHHQLAEPLNNACHSIHTQRTQ